MALSKEQLILLDTLAYYQEFSDDYLGQTVEKFVQRCPKQGFYHLL